jgi:hypothetical protein
VLKHFEFKLRYLGTSKFIQTLPKIFLLHLVQSKTIFRVSLMEMLEVSLETFLLCIYSNLNFDFSNLKFDYSCIRA